MGGAIYFKTRSRKFMKIKTLISLVMFGLCIYLLIITDYYVEDHPTLALIIATLATLCFFVGLFLAYQVFTHCRALRAREEVNPVRTVRFSSLLNVYHEDDQSFEEESIDGGSPPARGIPWSYTNDGLGRTPTTPVLGNLGRSWQEVPSQGPCVSGRGRRVKPARAQASPQASTSTAWNTGVTLAAGGLSPEVSAVPSFDYWMSLPKGELASQSQGNTFREMNSLWYENSDNFRLPEETQALSAKDEELFDNDDGEEMIL